MPHPTEMRTPTESAPAEPATPWLDLVTEKLSSLQYGTVQIVIHDAQVVQVESTEKFRFAPAHAARGKG